MPGGEVHNAGGRCEKCEEIAFEKVTKFIEAEVLPELRKLKSNKTGLEGFVLPPPRILEHDHRSVWEPKELPEEEYVFCHGDLSRSNIMLDPETLDVLCIIDWEYGGFFPEEFEWPMWRLTHREYLQTYEEVDKIFEEIALI
jgi:thiamine kinase-like enzyme